MNLFGVDVSQRQLIFGICLLVLLAVVLWGHSNALSMGYSMDSVPCNVCH